MIGYARNSVVPEDVTHIHAGQLLAKAALALEGQTHLGLLFGAVNLLAHKVVLVDRAEEDYHHVWHERELPGEAAAAVAAETPEASFAGLVLLVGRCFGDIAELVWLQDDVVRDQ